MLFNFCKRTSILIAAVFLVSCANTKPQIPEENPQEIQKEQDEISENQSDKTENTDETQKNEKPENPKVSENQENQKDKNEQKEQKEQKEQTSQTEQTEQIEQKKYDEKTQEISEEIQKSEYITLLFAGDIMAHEENYSGGKFERIWTYIAPFVKKADLAFANIEAPVMDSRKWQSYPTFCMHSDYVEQVISAGFDVFSLANNHTNDQGLEGIKSTRKYFESRKDIFACGLKEKQNDSITHKVVEKEIGGAKWKILFVALTEILNRPDYSSYIDYYPSSKEKRQKLKAELTKLKAETNPDIFVISIHTDEEEYVPTVTKNHRDFFRSLAAECRADVVWGNHPHIAKEWEQVKNGEKDALLMYANGNTISGQRRDPKFDKPETMRDYTGDGIMISAQFERKNGKISLVQTEPRLITTMIAPDGRYVLRFLDDDLLDSLDKAENLKWKNYLSSRKNIMEKYLPALKKKNENQ